MSIQFMAAVLAQERTAFSSTGERFVLLVLANHADPEGLCWPSVRRVADECGQSDGAVRRHLAALEAAGWLSKLERRRRPDGTLSVWVYRLDSALLAHRASVRGGAATSARRCADQRAPARALEPPPNPHQLKDLSTGSTARGADPQEDANGDRPEWSRAALAALDARDAALDAREAGSGVPDPSGNVQSHG